VRRRGFPTARVLAVGALALAVGTLLWVLTGIGSSTTSSSTAGSSTPSSSQPSPPPSSSTGGKTKPAIDWKTIPVAVLNGYDPTAPAASNARDQLKAAGWLIAGVSNTQTFGTTATYVTYPVGKLSAAKVVAQRLHLSTPVPLAQAAGVNPGLRNVAIVLGPNGLPSAAGA
jgi:LytR cell envelope-related transcriptional attenuator